MDTQANKDAALSFLSLVITGKVGEAFKTHVSPDCRHHNPHCAQGADALRQAMVENEVHFPHKIFEAQHILADGDLVAVHSRLEFKQNGHEFAVMHLFRFAKGKIVEFWDMAQQVPKDSPNQNPMF